MEDLLQRIKFFCSCIRNRDLLQKEIQESNLLPVNQRPTAGDLVVVQVLDDTCGYSSAEDTYGRSVRLFNEDIFVAILGNRNSGTNNVGRVPESPLRQGDIVSLLAQGGIVGEILCADNFQRKNKAQPLNILGFIGTTKGGVKNISEFRNINLVPNDYKLPKENKNMCFVFGSSAEAGKTTIVEKMIRTLKEKSPKTVIFASKAGGTGRLKDTLAYKDAGADISKDFVDLGYGTTYGLSKDEYIRILCSLYDHAVQKADFGLFEVGGDLLEEYAKIAMDFALKIKSKIILVVNDAMGALKGMELLNYQENKEYIFISTYKQNPYALERRINIPKVINTSSQNDIEYMLKNIINI